MTIETDWKSKAESFKAGVLAAIPPDWILPESLKPLPLNVSTLVKDNSILSEREQEIVSVVDATALRDAIASRTYTSVEVTTAYAKAAAIAHQVTNCLMDYFVEEALERARWLDSELERTGKPVGPLHGVPISVKDHLGLKGHQMTAGFVSWVGDESHIASQDATILSILRAAGANFIVKTTNPQAIMHLETDSFLGPTLNPHNRTLTPGGSSGGEGALIGAGASVLGIGTDIGGSIRNPAANCGIYGFKPTSIRLPKGGNQSAVAGQESIVGAIGPMGKSARDLELFVSTVLGGEPWRYDSTQAGMPWRPEEVKWKSGVAKPRIGVMWDDGVVRPQPPMRRALKATVDKLVAAGFQVVDYAPYKAAEGWDIISSLYFTDGGQRVREHCQAGGEPVLPLTEWIMSRSRACPPTDVFDLVKRREGFRQEYAAHFLAADIDVILCPPCPGPAPVLGTSKYWPYTSHFNLVDYPGAVFPTGLFVEPTDVADEAYDFLSEDDRNLWELYHPDTFKHAPLSLQLLAQRWEDEKVLKALQLISDVINP